MDLSALGKRIRRARKQAKLTQMELAAAAGISYSFLGNIERGRSMPGIETLVSIANALQCDVNSLLIDSLTAMNAPLEMDKSEYLRMFFSEPTLTLDESTML